MDSLLRYCFAALSSIILLNGASQTVVNPRERAILRGHEDVVNAVTFSPDGKILSSCSDDMTIRLWDVPGARLMATLRGREGSRIRSLAISPDGKVLASVGHLDAAAYLWDVPVAKEKGILKSLSPLVKCVAFSPNGKMIATGEASGLIRLWDISSGRITSTISAHGQSVSCVTFDPSGKLLASGSWDSTVCLWDLTTGMRKLSLRGVLFIRFVAFSPDGRTLAWGGSEGKVIMLDIAQAKSRLAFEESESRPIYSVSFSPDGGTLASGGFQRVTLWDIATGTKTPLVDNRNYASRSISFSPDGRILASGSEDGMIRLWDVVNRRQGSK